MHALLGAAGGQAAQGPPGRVIIIAATSAAPSPQVLDLTFRNDVPNQLLPHRPRFPRSLRSLRLLGAWSRLDLGGLPELPRLEELSVKQVRAPGPACLAHQAWPSAVP